MSQYLGTHVMRATSSTMALAANVLGFDIVELWIEDSGRLHCPYIHVDDALKEKYPEIISGHYPNHRKEHKRSPTVILNFVY